MREDFKIRIKKKDLNSYLFDDFRSLEDIQKSDLFFVLKYPERYEIEFLEASND